MFGLLLLSLLLTSCSLEEPISDQELEAELAKLTPEERQALLEELESQEDGALAGQASGTANKYKVPLKVTRASPVRVRTAINRIKVPPSEPQCGSDQECSLGYVCTANNCVPKPEAPTLPCAIIDCSSGYACVDGKCLQLCQETAQCPANSFCDINVCTPFPVDKAITPNAAMRAKSLGYEEEVWQQRDNFRDHMLIKLSNSVHWADYSSAQGWAVYHILTDLSSLSWAIDATADESRRSAYAALGKEILDLVVPILATELGTCSSDSECPYDTEGVGGTGGYRCVNNECVLRYLDEAHGTGGAGLVMNAIWEHKNLRNQYMADLTNWAQQLKPVLDRNILRTKSQAEGGYLSCSGPHMSAKIAPGYLAVGKILNDQSYIDAFTNIVEEISACMDKNSEGWPGANKDSGYAETDISHADIDTVVQHLGYREAQRGNIPAKVTEAQLAKLGDAFFLQEQLYYTTMPLGHSCLARFSAQMEARAEPSYPFTGGTYVGLDGKTYSFTEQPGSHAYTRKFETLAGYMIGFSIKISVD